MNFKQFIENANNRSIGASGGAGINPVGVVNPQQKLVPPQKNPIKLKGGSFGGGSEMPKEPPQPSSFSATSKGFDANQLKKFNAGRAIGMSGVGVFPQTHPYSPKFSPFSPGVRFAQQKK